MLRTAFPGSIQALEELPQPDRGLPAVPASKADERWGGAEHVWSHTLGVLLNADPRVWPACHQAVRMTLQACHGAVFPEDIATRRSAPFAEFTLIAPLNANELYYLLRLPGSERARSILFLLPERGGGGLSRHQKVSNPRRGETLCSELFRGREPPREEEKATMLKRRSGRSTRRRPTRPCTSARWENGGEATDVALASSTEALSTRRRRCVGRDQEPKPPSTDCGGEGGAVHRATSR